MKYLIFLLLMLTSVTCYSQDYIILVTKRDHKLSQATENYFKTTHVTQGLKKNHYILYKYYGNDIIKYVHAWGIKLYPSILHLRKENGQWYNVGVLDGQLTKCSVDNFLSIPREKYVEPPAIPTPQISNIANSIPGGS